MSRIRVLVVDDSREMREFVTEYVLEPNGFEVIQAVDVGVGAGSDNVLRGVGHAAVVPPVTHQLQLGIVVALRDKELARQGIRAEEPLVTGVSQIEDRRA